MYWRWHGNGLRNQGRRIMKTQLSRFYQKTLDERYQTLHEAGLSTDLLQSLQEPSDLEPAIANSLIENQISQYTLPMGLGLNFIIDDKECFIPMVTEEPSVIAAASHAAKLARSTGGFKTTQQIRQMTGQIVIANLKDPQQAMAILQENMTELMQKTNAIHPSMVKRGGGVTSIQLRPIKNEAGYTEFLTLNLTVDTQDAMGANMMNTILEGLSPMITEMIGGEALLRILSNLADQTLVTSTCRLPFTALSPNGDGQMIAERIVEATRYANLDPYRATTHNKGVMNGVDAIVLATGNDTRAIEAGVHAYASRSGRYQTLTNWSIQDDYLQGEITLPLPIGTVGGAIKVLPRAKQALEIMDVTKADELARIIAAVGLAQNLAALKALVSEGIQKGHMSLHAKSLAIHAGATGDEIEQVAHQLRQAPKMNAQTAQDILKQIRQ